MKYLYVNDIEHLIKKRRKLIFCLLLAPMICLFLNINSDILIIDKINLSMGTNLDIKNLNLIELILYLFNCVIFAYFIIDLYIKDIAYQLDNIFLRITPLKWFLKKTTVFSLLMLILKILQYLILYIILTINNKQWITDLSIINLVCNDYIYVSFIQYLFIFCYIVSSIFKSGILKFLPYTIFVTTMLIFPRNIYQLNMTFILMMALCIFGVICFISLILKKYSKRIIENV